jgi:hypothetical protein
MYTELNVFAAQAGAAKAKAQPRLAWSKQRRKPLSNNAGLAWFLCMSAVISPPAQPYHAPPAISTLLAIQEVRSQPREHATQIKQIRGNP